MLVVISCNFHLQGGEGDGWVDNSFVHHTVINTSQWSSTKLLLAALIREENGGEEALHFKSHEAVFSLPSEFFSRAEPGTFSKAEARDGAPPTLRASTSSYREEAQDPTPPGYVKTECTIRRAESTWTRPRTLGYTASMETSSWPPTVTALKAGGHLRTCQVLVPKQSCPV